MPKGVEHPKQTTNPKGNTIVSIAPMPKGVEQPRSESRTDCQRVALGKVSIASMPKGVEHVDSD